MDARSLTSLSALSFSFCVSLLRETVFMAISVLSSFFLTNLTEPNEPVPKSFLF